MILRNQKGIMMVGVLVVVTFFMMSAIAVSAFSVNHYLNTKRSLIALDALNLAEAGVDNFMYNINADNNYTGSSGEVTLYNDSVKGKGTYTTTVSAGTIANEKIVVSTGKIYLPATSTTPKVTRSIKAVIEGSATVDTYSVHNGPGGLILDNNSTISNGKVFVGGYITMGNNATIGTPTQTVPVEVGNYQCPLGNPPGGTFPTLCASGNPITFGNSGSHIYGTVMINNGSSDSHMTNPGYTAGTVSSASLPDPGRAAVKSTITTTMTASNASSCNSPYTTWNNVHITGNVSLPNNCTITINGNVWIDGNVTMGNNNIFAIGSTVTSTPQMMIDGSSGIDFGNGGQISANSASIGLYVVTYWNAKGDLDATTLTGNDLYNSMYISNDRTNPRYTITTGNHSSAASGTTLYARWSGINVSNTGNMGQILGQIIRLSNGGNITMNGSGIVTGAYTWDVRFYVQTFQ